MPSHSDLPQHCEIPHIIGMGLKLHVVAEGVETRDELAFLRLQGCAAYQGYLFSKPVSANQLQHLLRDR